MTESEGDRMTNFHCHPERSEGSKRFFAEPVLRNEGLRMTRMKWELRIAKMGLGLVIIECKQILPF